MGITSHYVRDHCDLVRLSTCAIRGTCRLVDIILVVTVLTLSGPQTVTYALFDLCLHPEYIEALRAEVDGSAFEDFVRTTKGLPLLDSFIKESSRLSPIEASKSGSAFDLRSYC
jgi:hypothetical protein